MGLDMYAYKSKHKPDKKCNFREYAPPDTDWSEINTAEEELAVVTYEIDKKGDKRFHDWRKHPNLHGWMMQLYLDNDGYIRPNDWAQFNGNSVELDKDDLKALETDIKSQSLPHTEGFFFGESYGWKDREEIDSEDLEFVRKAREAIDEGLFVYYTSSW